MPKRKKVSDSEYVTADNDNTNIKTEMGLKQTLIKTRNAIRKKFQDLHHGKQILREQISEKYKPIIEPIKSLSNDKVKKPPEKVDSTPIKNEKENETDSIFKTAFPNYRRKLFATTVKKSRFQPILDINDIQHEQSEINDDDYNNSVKKRIHEQAKQINSAEADHIYGIRLNHGEYYMGRAPIKVEKDNEQLYFVVKNKKFPVTSGLTDLLLMSNPQNYTSDDLETYRDMLELTNAHKKNYNVNGLVRRSKSSVKYNEIISDLFPERRSNRLIDSQQKSKQGKNYERVRGKGVKCQIKKPQTVYKTFNRSGVYDYKYWDNPNELVDRLRLLVSSQTAGHTGHNNEIIAIIEELQEAKIIV